MEKLDIWKRRNIVFTFKYWLADLLSMGRGSNYRNERLRDAYIEDCCNYIGEHFELPLPHFVSEEDHDFEDFEEFYGWCLAGHCENVNNADACDKYMDAEQNLVHRVLFEARPYESAEGFYGQKIWKYFLMFWEEKRQEAENEKELMEKDEENDEDYEESPYLLYNDQIGTEEFQNVMLSGIWKEVDFFEAWEGDSCCVTEPIYNYIHQETAKKLKEEKNNVICDNKGL